MFERNAIIMQRISLVSANNCAGVVYKIFRIAFWWYREAMPVNLTDFHTRSFCKVNALFFPQEILSEAYIGQSVFLRRAARKPDLLLCCLP